MISISLVSGKIKFTKMIVNQSQIYHPFVFGPTETSQDGTGFYIKESLVYVRRDDLKFNSPGNYESTFIDIILPDRKNLILGCVYRHPTSTISV